MLDFLGGTPDRRDKSNTDAATCPHSGGGGGLGDTPIRSGIQWSWTRGSWLRFPIADHPRLDSGPRRLFPMDCRE